MSFTHVNENGDLDTIENGIHIVLPNEDLRDIVEVGLEYAQKEKQYRYDHSKRSTYLLYQYNVEVVSVDEQNKEVIVSQKSLKMRDRDKVTNILRYKVANAQPERKEIQNQVEKEVDRLMSEELAEKVELMKPKTRANLRKKLIREKMTKESEERGLEKIIVHARVVSVGKNGCIVNLLGMDIPGYVPKHFWSHSYVEDMNSVVEKGDVIDLCVLAYPFFFY